MLTTTTTSESKADGRDPVANYATADGAERAVSHLISLGYDERDVALAPRDFDVEDPRPLRRRLGTGVRQGAVVGACVAGAVEALGRIGVDAVMSSVLPVVGMAAVVGAFLGLIVGVIVHRRARAVAFGPDPERLVPNRYVVLVDQEPGRARHGLARWWDPAAPPPGQQQPA